MTHWTDVYGSDDLDQHELHRLVCTHLSGRRFQARESLYHGGDYWKSDDDGPGIIKVQSNQIPFLTPEPIEEDHPEVRSLVRVEAGGDAALDDLRAQILAIPGLRHLYRA